MTEVVVQASTVEVSIDGSPPITIEIGATNVTVETRPGLTTISAATDTDFANLVDRDFVVWDAASGKFINLAVTFSASLSGLTDTIIAGLTDGEVLVSVGGDWLNATYSEAGLSAVGHTHTIAAATDTAITTPADGQLLVHNGTDWENFTKMIISESPNAVSGTDFLFDFSSSAGLYGDVTIKTGSVGTVSFYNSIGYGITIDPLNGKFIAIGANQVSFETSAGLVFEASASQFRPGVDNTTALGSPVKAWTGVYAGGFIQFGGLSYGGGSDVIRYRDQGLVIGDDSVNSVPTSRVAFFNSIPIVQPLNNLNTTGATLAALETEVNELKQMLRDLGLMAT